MKKDNEPKKLIFLFLGAFLIMIFIMIFANKAHAASQTGPQLPILIENIDVTPYQTYINNTYGGFWDLSQNNVIGWGNQENGYFVQTFAIPQVPDQVQDYLTFSPGGLVGSYPDFDYNNNTLTLTFTNLANDNYKPWRIISFYSNGTGPNYPYSAAFNQTYTINKGVYGSTGNTINYISSDIYLTNNNAWVVNMPVFVTEIPSIPLPDNDTYPEGSEKPELSDYYNTDNAPLFDNSSTTSAIQSLFELTKWFFGNNGIGGIINYLIESINWGLQKIINNIRTVLQNVSTELQEVINDFSDIVSGFLSDIKDFVSDIKDKLADLYDGFMEFADLFIHPFDQEEYEEQISDCELINQYNTLIDNCEVIQQIFDYAEEENHFSLYIDFENPFADSEHKIIHSEINFDWLVPLRSVYRPFLWVFTLFECFVGGMRVLGNVIGGKAK